jgi:hypothetical protein
MKPEKIRVSPPVFALMRERFFQAEMHGIDAHSVTLAVLEDLCGFPVRETQFWRGPITIEVDWGAQPVESQGAP